VLDGDVKGLQVLNLFGMASIKLMLALNVLEGLMIGVENELISH